MTAKLAVRTQATVIIHELPVTACHVYDLLRLYDAGEALREERLATQQDQRDEARRAVTRAYETAARQVAAYLRAEQGDEDAQRRADTRRNSAREALRELGRQLARWSRAEPYLEEANAAYGVLVERFGEEG